MVDAAGRSEWDTADGTEGRRKELHIAETAGTDMYPACIGNESPAAMTPRRKERIEEGIDEALAGCPAQPCQLLPHTGHPCMESGLSRRHRARSLSLAKMSAVGPSAITSPL